MKSVMIGIVPPRQESFFKSISAISANEMSANWFAVTLASRSLTACAIIVRDVVASVAVTCIGHGYVLSKLSQESFEPNDIGGWSEKDAAVESQALRTSLLIRES